MIEVVLTLFIIEREMSKPYPLSIVIRYPLLSGLPRGIPRIRNLPTKDME